jgi:hypothetical protein
MENAAPERDGNGVGPIVGLKFVYQIFDVKVDRSLGNCQFVRDLLVAVTIPDEPQDFQLSRGKRLISDMFRQTLGCL